MEEAYFLGGYYLVEGSLRQDWMNASLLPQTFYSLSTCGLMKQKTGKPTEKN